MHNEENEIELLTHTIIHWRDSTAPNRENNLYNAVDKFVERAGTLDILVSE